MKTTFNKIKPSQEQGFTLIELLIVIVIIGVLAAIALPIFMNQQKASHLAELKNDTRNAILHVETWKQKNPQATTFNLTLRDNFSSSRGSFVQVVGNPTDYCIQSYNINSPIRGVPDDTPNRPSYLLYTNSTGKISEQNLWISLQSCATSGTNNVIGFIS